jgi:hypothetical protein
VQSPREAGADGYRVSVLQDAGTDSVRIYRVVNRSQTLLDTESQDFSVGDRLGLEVTDTGTTVTLRVYLSASGSGTWSQIGGDISTLTRIASSRQQHWDVRLFCLRELHV